MYLATKPERPMLGIGLHQESIELDEEDPTDSRMRIVRVWRELKRGPVQIRAIDQEDGTILSTRSCWQTIHTKDRAEILYSTAHSEHIPEFTSVSTPITIKYRLLSPLLRLQQPVYRPRPIHMPRRRVRVLERSSIYQMLQSLVVIPVCILLRIVLDDPPAQVHPHLLTVSALVVELRVHLLLVDHAKGMEAGHALEAEQVVDTHSRWNVILASNIETSGERDGVFDGLCAAIAAGGQECVCCISQLNHATSRRRPI
jgi:hypothetical protein